MSGTPALWTIPDTPDYGRNGKVIERTFWVVDEVSTVLALATETASTGIALVVADVAFLLGTFSIAVGGVIGEFLAIGAGYAEAKTIVVKDWMTRGFARGCVVGAHGRNSRTLVRIFGHDPIAVDDWMRGDVQKAYIAGLSAGFADAWYLRAQQKQNLWYDLETRADDRWGREEHDNEAAAGRFYAGLAGTFRRYHLTES
jgi:hypothetical protein